MLKNQLFQWVNLIIQNKKWKKKKKQKILKKEYYFQIFNKNHLETNKF